MSIEAMKQALEPIRDAAFDEEGYTLNADLAEAYDTLRQAIEQSEKQVVFKIYKPTLPRGALPNVRDAELPWVYDQDSSSGNVASMWVTPVKATPQPQQVEKQEPIKIDGNTSDGYHTFNELYEFRKAYNVALFNEWASGGKCSVHKSWRHHDGELCFGGGWFIVVAVLPQGQISNHYEAKDWNLFAIPEVERALFEFDGHTGNDVIERLEAYTTPQPQREWVGLIRGVRVDGDTVVITVKGGNEAARKLCAELLKEKNT